MLYIKEINLTTETFKTMVENMKPTVENDYYADCNHLTHPLPLPVLNLVTAGETHVKSGYTVNQYAFVYSSCAGNMAGVFEAWNDKFYFFMAGRRHGVINALDYLPKEFVPLDYENPLIYISNNVDVKPTHTDVGYGNSRFGTVWNEEVEIDAYDIFAEGVSTKVNNHLKSVIKCGAALYGGELPVDVVDVQIEAITLEVGSPAQWAPTVTIDGIRFKAEQIVSDANGLTLYGGKTKLTIAPEKAGNNNTRIKLTKVPSA